MGLSEELEEVGAHGEKIIREVAGINLDKSMKLPEFICSPHNPSKVSMFVASFYKSWSPQRQYDSGFPLLTFFFLIYI